MLRSAENSIRPDKVHKLINIIKNLEKRFPISDGFYKPFISKWAESLASKSIWKQESWDFFLNGEYLIRKNYPKREILDFSNGVPVDFDTTLSARK